MRSIFHYLIFGVIIFGAWGCRTTQKTASSDPTPTADRTNGDASKIDYTLIYMIHGDGNYLYHDEDGKRLQADEQQLEEAISVAKQAKHGEVFIFHQRSEEKILWLFPKKDRLFLHYQNGERINRKKYSPLPNNVRFAKEAQFYHRFRSQKVSRNIFLYYGHEIPELKKRDYFQSRPEAEFSTRLFADGLGSFLNPEEKFDLTVLSTCDNGTPVMISELQGKTKYLLASPENLHLSHIDSERLLQLEQQPNQPVSELSHSIAEASFKRLADFLQTVVTLSIYDMEVATQGAVKLSRKYVEYRQQKKETLVEKENVDCAMLPFWKKRADFTKGVEVFFKPPSFGSNTNQASHSGWGCQP